MEHFPNFCAFAGKSVVTLSIFVVTLVMYGTPGEVIPEKLRETDTSFVEPTLSNNTIIKFKLL